MKLLVCCVNIGSRLIGKPSLSFSISRRMASSGVSVSKWQLEERTGDLFQAPADCSLAHCVSEDLHMGKGIAVAFKQKFGRVDELKKQGKKPGDVAVLEVDGRHIYYLVTKKRYSGKPTYPQLQASLEAMRDHCVQAGVTHLAMPRIGCGLDRLDYNKVKNMVSEVFGHTSIAITIYSL